MLDAAGASMLQEYRYRRLFPGLTHEQYLDEPLEVIEWMLRLEQLVEPRDRRRGSGGDGGAARSR